MHRRKFLSALPFLHTLDESNLDEAFPTISDTGARLFRGSFVRQAVPSASGIRCGLSIEITASYPSLTETTPIFFHHPTEDLPSTFDDAATCTFRALILKPTPEAASKAINGVNSGLNGVSSSQEAASTKTTYQSEDLPTNSILVFAFASSSQPYMVDPLHIKQVRLEKPTESLPPSLVFVFETVIFRIYEIAETFMTPGDDVQESMQTSYQRLSASYKEVTELLKACNEIDKSTTLTVNQTRKLVTEGRFVAGSKHGSPETSVCSNKQGAQAQESEKLTDEVVADGVARSGTEPIIPSVGDELATAETKTTSIEDVMLRPDALLEKAEGLAPAAKKRRAAKENTKRLITNILSPKTVPSINIVEASKFLPEGYLQKLGGEAQEAPLTPNSELSNQLNKCAEEIMRSHVTLTEEDTIKVSEMNDKIAKSKENLDNMVRAAYKVGGKGSKKRKSLDGEGKGRADEGNPVPGEDDVKEAFEEVLVAVRAKNLLIWG